MCYGPLQAETTYPGAERDALNHWRPQQMHIRHFPGVCPQIAAFATAGGSSGPSPRVAEAGHGPPAHSSSSAAVLLYTSQSPGFWAGGLHCPQPVGRAEARWSSQLEGCTSRRSSSAPSAPGLGPDKSRGHLSTADQPKPTAHCRPTQTDFFPSLRATEETWSGNYFP